MGPSTRLVRWRRFERPPQSSSGRHRFWAGVGAVTPRDRPQRPPTAAKPPPKHPLEGVTIVEFGYFYAMPFAATMAAALGARVIKLEDEHGDPMREMTVPRESGYSKVMEGKESLAD